MGAHVIAEGLPAGRTVGVLALISTINALSTSAYLPALPAAGADLDMSTATAQLTLTAYLVGIAAGQSGPGSSHRDGAADRGIVANRVPVPGCDGHPHGPGSVGDGGRIPVGRTPGALGRDGHGTVGGRLARRPPIQRQRGRVGVGVRDHVRVHGGRTVPVPATVGLVGAGVRVGQRRDRRLYGRRHGPGQSLSQEAGDVRQIQPRRRGPVRGRSAPCSRPALASCSPRSWTPPPQLGWWSTNSQPPTLTAAACAQSPAGRAPRARLHLWQSGTCRLASKRDLRVRPRRTDLSRRPWSSASRRATLRH